MAALSIMDKVKCIIEMQRRLQPIYAQKQMNRQTISHIIIQLHQGFVINDITL